MIKGDEGHICTYATEIGKWGKYCEQLYANILENLEEMGKFHEMEMGYSVTKWSVTHYKIDNVVNDLDKFKGKNP